MIVWQSWTPPSPDDTEAAGWTIRGGHNAIHTSDDLVEEDDRRRQLKVTRPLTSFDCLCYGGYFGTPQRQSLEALGSLDRAGVTARLSELRYVSQARHPLWVHREWSWP
jgi:hypothetical protein